MPGDGQIKSQESFSDRSTSGLLPLPHRGSIFLFCAATFFYWTSLYLYVPILPVYAQSLGASLSMVGIVVASYALPQMLLRIPIGIWSDNFGRRKPFVAGGIVMTLFGALGLGLAPNPLFLCLARIAAGIGAATWVVFTVFLASYYPLGVSGRAIGIINFVQGLALVMATSGGGAIGGVWGFRYSFFGAALLGVVALVVLSFTKEPAIRRVKTTSWHSFTQVATRPLLLMASSMAFLAEFTIFSAIFGFIPVYGAQIGASSTVYYNQAGDNLSVCNTQCSRFFSKRSS